MFSMVMLIPKIAQKLVKSKPEIIVLNYPSVHTGLLGFLAAKILRKPCVVDFNDLIAQYTIGLLNLKRTSLLSKMTSFLSLLNIIVMYRSTTGQVLAPSLS